MSEHYVDDEKQPLIIKKLNIVINDAKLNISSNEYEELASGVSLKVFLEMLIKSNEQKIKMLNTDTTARIGCDGVVIDEIFLATQP